MRRLAIMYAASVVLAACSSQHADEETEKFLADDLQVFLDAGALSDTIYMVDSFGMKDRFVQKREVKQDQKSMDFRVQGDWFYLDMKVSVRPSADGGFVEMTTSYESLELYYNTSKNFEYRDGELVHDKDCKLGWVKSMYLDGAKYSDVLVFSPECAGGAYKFDRMYYAAEEGLIRVDLNDSVTLFRVLE